MKEVSAQKKKLTRKAMSFIDEAVRLSREEKQRQAEERREARRLGMKQDFTVTIEDEKPPSPPPAMEEYDEEQARHAELGDDYVPRAAESGSDEDRSDHGGESSRKRKRDPPERVPSQKERMKEAL